jgi:hypothetical protein
MDYEIPETKAVELVLTIRAENWSADVAEEFINYSKNGGYSMMLNGSPHDSHTHHIYIKVLTAEVKT